LIVELPRQGSNLDSSDPESDVLPVTPQGNEIIQSIPENVKDNAIRKRNANYKV
jgi:hypothetical protein